MNHESSRPSGRTVPGSTTRASGCDGDPATEGVEPRIAGWSQTTSPPWRDPSPAGLASQRSHDRVLRADAGMDRVSSGWSCALQIEIVLSRTEMLLRLLQVAPGVISALHARHDAARLRRGILPTRAIPSRRTSATTGSRSSGASSKCSLAAPSPRLRWRACVAVRDQRFVVRGTDRLAVADQPVGAARGVERAGDRGDATSSLVLEVAHRDACALDVVGRNGGPGVPLAQDSAPDELFLPWHQKLSPAAAGPDSCLHRTRGDVHLPHPSRPSPGQLVVRGSTDLGEVTAVVDVVQRHR